MPLFKILFLELMDLVFIVPNHYYIYKFHVRRGKNLGCVSLRKSKIRF